MSDHIDRAAEVIDSCALGDKGIRIIGSDHYPSINVARALDIAGLLVTPAHDAEVAARAWDEGWQDACCLHGGYASCGKPDAHNHGAANPYREREGGDDAKR